RGLQRIMPMFLLFLVLVLLIQASEPIIVLAMIHLVVFFIVSLVCHGELARNRPAREQLTSFYLWLSVGGVLGGVICTLGAPLVFSRIGPVEYPLLLVMAALVRPGLGQRLRVVDWLAPAFLAVATVALVLLVPRWLGPTPEPGSLDETVHRLLRGGLM